MKQSSHNSNSNSNSKDAAVWDCGSSLYDSFELKSFERQLDSAISSSRSMSMPHLSDHRRQPINKKPALSKIPRSLHRLIRSIFRSKNTNSFLQQTSNNHGHGYYVDKSAVLSTIPETPEFDGLSPEIRSLVTRTASDRQVFTVPDSLISRI